ncbi:uncharacterized protein LOC103673817 [Ursus maritimus]|uniref:Uncharacterized protein LOC103673817 n=2 Tax=Ursus TaxID=9639 RepID=A0A8M1G386_URSMA|nr:uncharacterized protein LOC103673817 [Ursus maritimus]
MAAVSRSTSGSRLPSSARGHLLQVVYWLFPAGRLLRANLKEEYFDFSSYSVLVIKVCAENGTDSFMEFTLTCVSAFPFTSHSRSPSSRGERACPAPRPALSVHSLVKPDARYSRVPSKPRPHAVRRAERRRGYCAAGRFRQSPLVRIGKRSRTRAVRVGARSSVPRSRRERPVAAAGARSAPPLRLAESARARGGARAPVQASVWLRGTGWGGWAAEVRGEEPELLPPPPPPLQERSMSATQAKKVKMATKSCPECDQQVPVACKSCPCGYVFINRKLLKVKNSEKSSSFTEVNSTISLKDLRILFLYEFKLGHSAATASRNINSVFGKGSVSERTIRWWFEKFRSGDLSLKNEPRGRPKSVLNEDQLRAMVEANPKTAIRGLAADLGVSATTISRHLAAIGKVKKLDKWVGNTN